MEAKSVKIQHPQRSPTLMDLEFVKNLNRTSEARQLFTGLVEGERRAPDHPSPLIDLCVCFRLPTKTGTGQSVVSGCQNRNLLDLPN